MSQGNLHVEAFCTRCQPTVVATVTREGVVVGSGSATVEANDEARSDTPVMTRSGDVLSIAVDGETIATRTVTFPTANPVQCGSTTLTGSFDPSTPLLHAIASRNGGIEEAVPSASGNGYTASFAQPFEADEGLVIEEAARDDTHSLPAYGPVDLVTHFSASVLCETAVDTDHDGIPDSADQCPTEAGPAPTGCPATPPPSTDAPVAGCDAYWTQPQTAIHVAAAQGVLVNDEDPNGLPLTTHVVAINFGLSSHSYKLNATSGALDFYPGRQTKPFEAIMTYEDTNSAGTSSRPTTIRIFVQPNRPAASLLKPCPRATGSFTSLLQTHPVWTDHHSHCTSFLLTEHRIPISDSKAKVKGTLSFGAEGAKNDLCWAYSYSLKETWKLHAKSWVKWTAAPGSADPIADEIGITDSIEVDGKSLVLSLSLNGGFTISKTGAELGAGVSVGLQSSSTPLRSNADADRSLTTHAGSDIDIQVKSEDSYRITETLAPRIALKGVDLAAHDVDTTKSYPPEGAHACVITTVNGLGEEAWYWEHGNTGCQGSLER